MPLTLTYRAETKVPVEIEGITPDTVRELSLDAIRRLDIYHGNQTIPLGAMFDIEGDPSDLEFEMHGNLSGVHWIGAHMREGRIQIHGPAGRHLGSEMLGGAIIVHGDAGDWVGGEMHGGLIRVHGSAGHQAGSAYRGSLIGMTGGTILIDGNAGNEIGHTMRRGLIAIGGTCDDLIGFNMLAGTVFVFGNCGIRSGAGMRRGTLALLGPEHPVLMPSFRHACRYRPVILGVLLRQLRAWKFPFDEDLLSSEIDIFNGDFIDGGRGEIFIRPMA
ncbi:MAG: formylmethanofuran dehydrogenase subunit C [Pirellulales bacterium]|nr:formylmethanofuran dehydrogenase subunit C [Pirellulales bacterium]